MASDRRTVLITGCSSGFGRAMVDEFLARGWHVIATMRRAQERRELLAGPLEAHPDRVTLLDFDVTDAGQRAAVVAATKEHGRLDCLVSNAGYGLYGALENVTEAQFRTQFETNFFGATFLIRDCLPMLRDAKGVVVVISSTFGINGFPLTTGYCTTKFALEALAESLYYELAPHGVHVGLLEPGANVTGFGVRVQWGEGDVPAYREQTAGYRRLKKKVGARAGDDSVYIAGLTADLAERRSTRLRRLVGLDSFVGYWTRRLVPEWLLAPIQRALYSRIFRGG